MFVHALPQVDAERSEVRQPPPRLADLLAVIRPHKNVPDTVKLTESNTAVTSKARSFTLPRNGFHRQQQGETRVIRAESDANNPQACNAVEWLEVRILGYNGQSTRGRDRRYPQVIDSDPVTYLG